MKTYSGKYIVKNKGKYEGDPSNIQYRSMWERHCFEWCDNNSKVTKWSSEEVIVPYYYEVDKRYHRYFVDLKIVIEGKTLLVEVKPHKQTSPPKGKINTKSKINEAYTYVKNSNKWEAANEYANDRGWKFVIWTEKELTEMGILPKTPGKLKKQKALRPYRKKKPKK